MHLFQGQREQKVFVVHEFHFFYKETVEDVCHVRISQLLQREWELKACGIREVSHLLQGQGETECVCYQGVSHVWVFVVREMHLFQ